MIRANFKAYQCIYLSMDKSLPGVLFSNKVYFRILSNMYSNRLEIIKISWYAVSYRIISDNRVSVSFFLSAIEVFMAKKKNKRKPNKSKLTPIERVLKKKADHFLKAERKFWKYRYELEEQQRKNADALGLKISQTIPDNLSTIVWALKDGVTFVRYQDDTTKGHVGFRSVNITLEQWGNEGLVVPTSKGEISLAQSGLIRGLGSITIQDCTFNDLHIGYVEFRHAYYDKKELPSAIERAIIDFQLAFLGAQIREKSPTPVATSSKADQTISKLEEIAKKFEGLLETADREEELQVFLKENPLVLNPTAEQIPKKKLGEDFITDFVLVTPSQQGPTYTLVEIEKVSHRVLIKDNSLSTQANHAIKQTLDWDVWLESNKAYFQNKLPGFETPNYLVVIGRGNEMDDTAKAYLRSYNRTWKNTELLTYDDVLIRFKSVIMSLKNAIEIA